MKPFSIVRLPTVAEAQSRALEGPDTRVFRAGGIDLLDRMKEGLEAPTHLVELGAVTGDAGGRMRGIRDTDEAVTVGALTTLAELADAEMAAGYRALQTAAGDAANPGIRNSATVGGNLLQRPRCWYFRDRELSCLKKGGDRCLAVDGRNRYHAVLGGGPAYIVHPSSLGAPLTALGARATILGADGTERTIPFADLFHLPSRGVTTEHNLQAGEILLEVLLPKAGGTQRSSYAVAKERAAYDWPLAEAAVRLDLDGGVMKNVRVGLGHVAPVPWDAPAAAKVLEGQKPDAALFEKAGQAAFEKAQPLSDNGYKIPLGVGLVRKALHEATDLPLPE